MNDDRVEAKIGPLPIMNGTAEFEIMQKLDKPYLRVDGHAEPHGHGELQDFLCTLSKHGRQK